MIAVNVHRLLSQCRVVLKEVKTGCSQLMMTQMSNELVNSGKNSARTLIGRYATRVITDIFHLVQPSGQQTLCGLRISRVTSERKANTLQLINQLQPNLAICKHCERIRGQDAMA